MLQFVPDLDGLRIFRNILLDVVQNLEARHSLSYVPWSLYTPRDPPHIGIFFFEQRSTILH